MKSEVRNLKHGTASKFGFRILAAFACLISLTSPFTYAQNTPANEDITSSNFSLVVCDGPDNLRHIQPDGTYDAGYSDPNFRPCDFYAAMREVQHLINIMIIVGILAAIAGFCYAGFLYIVHGSEPSSRSEASSVFKKVFIGFIIMLTAWFIVYQILSWLQCGANSTDCRSVGTALLGN